MVQIELIRLINYAYIAFRKTQIFTPLFISAQSVEPLVMRQNKTEHKNRFSIEQSVKNRNNRVKKHHEAHQESFLHPI